MNSIPRLRIGQSAGLLQFQVFRRNLNARRPKKPTVGFQGPKGHGEKLWVHAHRRTDQIIYSFSKQLDGFHSLKQLPFNGKKTKPAKLRKDYWYQMAEISFGEGQGHVGRSVFQKLRELKHLHEVNWPNEFRFKTPEEYTDDDRKKMNEREEKGWAWRPHRSKKERGVALNAQKPNAIADIAVVLAGQGKGNRMVEGVDEDGANKLRNVTVQWADELDIDYAQEWTDNVAHSKLNQKWEIEAEATEAYESGFDSEPLEPSEELPASIEPVQSEVPAPTSGAPKKSRMMSKLKNGLLGYTTGL